MGSAGLLLLTPAGGLPSLDVRPTSLATCVGAGSCSDVFKNHVLNQQDLHLLLWGTEESHSQAIWFPCPKDNACVGSSVRVHVCDPFPICAERSKRAL